MKTLAALFVFALASVSAAPALPQALDAPPAWAYPINPPGLTPLPDDGTLRRVPGSRAAFTLTQLRDRFFAPVWHPGDQPPLPEVVASGRNPDVFACGFCHRANGPGGPENANLAGLPYGYFVQTMKGYRSGARKTSAPGRNTELMISLSKGITDGEIEAAARYFSALKPRSIVSVVEADTVPKTYVVSNHFAVAKGDEKEAIGRRIIEVPEDLERFVSRDSRTRFVAYVPPGSVQVGRELAANGGGNKAAECASCHGPGLKGVANIPGLAGRSPSYLMRQLYDFKSGARRGVEGDVMKPIVEKLTIENMMSLSAYAASRAP